MRTGMPARIAAGLCGLGIVASLSQPAAQQQEPQEPLRLRIGVTAVEIDAVVTGEGGRHITDLRPEEFEIYQDGRKQTVVSARYVPATPSNAGADDRDREAASAEAGPPSARTPRREDIRHTVAIVVDDLNLSFRSTNHVRSALKRFVERDMQEGDLVSIVYTGKGVGRFQPFTTDRHALLRVAERLRFNRVSRISDSVVAPRLLNELKQEDRERATLDGVDSLWRDGLVASSLNAVSTVIRGMRDMPGRKSVVLVSDGWSLVTLPASGPLGPTSPAFGPRVYDAMRRLVDEANRSFVVIYTVDARGVEGPELSVDARGIGPIGPVEDKGRMPRFESHTGPRELADLGGGLYLRGNNNLAGLMRRAMEDQRGYYLIGYQPEEDTFTKSPESRARFHAVQVRVTRPGLKVRARRGFFGLTDEELEPAPPRSRDQRLLLVLNQPFASADVGLETTGLFWRHPAQGGMVRALLTIDPSALTFRRDDQGRQHAPIEVGAALIDERGAIASLRTLSIAVAGDAQYRSFTYPIDLPVEQAGVFQLRTAVRDVRSTRQGSASEFVIVPDSKSSRLALSGLMLAGAPVSGPVLIETGMTATHASPSFAAAEEEFVAAPAALNPVRPEAADPARRHFEPGMEVDYTYQVYNAGRDRATRRPALIASYRLFRDGTLLRTGPLEPETRDAPGEALAKPRTMLCTGRLTLPDELPAGTYDLEVVVTDTLGEKNRPATQWTSFTVSPRQASGGVPAPRGR